MVLQIPAAKAEDITYRYKASPDPLVRQAQDELVRTYGALRSLTMQPVTKQLLCSRVVGTDVVSIAFTTMW